ncbi:serine/arginine-rich splicing factor 4 [Drosophila bipectinata]|uniref:serine/arginine-rich splicing factor 4 n=1 Tax=Drosophila bipectinata TaxID=42026 RepID=UPI0038B2E68D
MSHLPLDARAILQHLNELGYRNISAEQLREFLKDLRKLIKYEERLAENAKEDNFSSLHKRSTASSRAKLSGDGDKNKENTAPGPSSSSALFVKEKEFKTDREDARSGAGADFDELARQFREKLLMEASIPPVFPPKQNSRQASAKSEPTNRRRSRSASGRQPPPSSGESDAHAAERARAQRRRRSKSRARSASRGSPTGRRKNRHTDPVALYQYYQKEWAHFRGQIPGELPKLSSRFGARNRQYPK